MLCEPPSNRCCCRACVSLVQRRQELLRGMTDGDAVLLIGGALTVTVEQAQGLYGSSKYTHPFARITVMEPFKGTVNQLGKTACLLGGCGLGGSWQVAA